MTTPTLLPRRVRKTVRHGCGYHPGSDKCGRERWFRGWRWLWWEWGEEL